MHKFASRKSKARFPGKRSGIGKLTIAKVKNQLCPHLL